MRAIYLSNLGNLSIDQEISVEGDQAHHLINVIRIKLNEKILILDGAGTQAIGTILTLQKRSLVIKIASLEFKLPFKLPTLGLGITKKEALEDILKASVEMGLPQIQPLKTQFSQPEIDLKIERIDRLLISALEQSNNPYLPKIKEAVELKNLNFSAYQKVFFFTTSAKSTNEFPSDINLDQCLYLIGPEGGFSPEEEIFITNHSNVVSLNLPIPILRAKTAAILALGYLLP